MGKSRVAKLGLIQITANYSRTVEQNLCETLELIEKCLQEGADLVFTAEEGQYYSASKASRKELIEQYSADFLSKCSELAKRYEAYVLPWDYEVGDDGNVYNTTFVYDRQGKQIGKYRKTQITQGEMDKGISTGDDFPVFELDFGTVGIMICLDNYYPEAATILANRGAELILYPLYGDTMTGRWETKMKARAIDNTVYIAPCHIHSSPKEARASYTGLVDPEGNVVARLEEEGSYQVIEVEMGKQIVTQMAGVGQGIYEDTKQYLRKLRNPIPFKPVLDEVETLPWEDIRWRGSQS